ncbi:MAG TPA: hypothetical protein PLK77_11370 [Pyrinomonadaceae bacterium]|nr:hypothetical protein [Pyrinomonadaceae bacterium]
MIAAFAFPPFVLLVAAFAGSRQAVDLQRIEPADPPPPKTQPTQLEENLFYDS